MYYKTYQNPYVCLQSETNSLATNYITQNIELMITYLGMSADLYAHETLQHGGEYLQVCVNELSLHVQTKQREAISQLNVGDHRFLGDHLVLEVLNGVSLSMHNQYMYKIACNLFRSVFANYDGLCKTHRKFNLLFTITSRSPPASDYITCLSIDGG